VAGRLFFFFFFFFRAALFRQLLRRCAHVYISLARFP
jgi:hypothetical protein